MEVNLHSFFLSTVRKKGGFVCHHAHLDKAYLITPQTLEASQNSLQEKWYLYRKLKEEYTHESLRVRMIRGVDYLMSQGVSKCRTFVDADDIVGTLPVEVALEIKKEYKGKELKKMMTLRSIVNKYRTRPVDRDLRRRLNKIGFSFIKSPTLLLNDFIFFLRDFFCLGAYPFIILGTTILK